MLEFSADHHQILREVGLVMMPEGQVIVSGFNPRSLLAMGRWLASDRTAHPGCGSFIPLQSLPAAVRSVAPATPFYWGNTGYGELLAGGGLADVLPNVAVLAAIGIALLALGSWALGRSVRRGGSA